MTRRKVEAQPKLNQNFMFKVLAISAILIAGFTGATVAHADPLFPTGQFMPAPDPEPEYCPFVTPDGGCLLEAPEQG